MDNRYVQIRQPWWRLSIEALRLGHDQLSASIDGSSDSPSAKPDPSQLTVLHRAKPHHELPTGTRPFPLPCTPPLYHAFALIGRIAIRYTHHTT